MSAMEKDPRKLSLHNEEVWRDIPEFEGYAASNLGKIKSKDRTVIYKNGVSHRMKGKILPASIKSKGNHYLRVVLSVNTKEIGIYVHQLVLLAFDGILSDRKYQTRHLDGNKFNNCLHNLEYGSSKRNHEDRILHGTLPKGEDCTVSKLTERQVKMIRKELNEGKPYKVLAKEYKISTFTVYDIRRRKTWKHI